MGQITFSIDPKLEEDFRKKAGALYGARKSAIGVALRDAIRDFLQVKSDMTSEECEVKCNE